MQGIRFEPTEEQRRTVRAMSGFGIPQDDIATFLDVEPKTLRKHFRRELDRGMVEATAKVAQSLFQMATTGNNVAAAIFWMKARAGWSEKQRIEHGMAGSFGVISSVPYLDAMSDAELERIARRGRDEDPPKELTPEEWSALYGPEEPTGSGNGTR